MDLDSDKASRYFVLKVVVKSLSQDRSTFLSHKRNAVIGAGESLDVFQRR